MHALMYICIYADLDVYINAYLCMYIYIYTYAGENNLGGAILLMGLSIDNVSATSTNHADAQCNDLEEPLAEFLRLINSVKLALHQRFDKKNDYLAALTDVEAKQISHNKKVCVYICICLYLYIYL
jgi:hypothetical protein